MRKNWLIALLGAVVMAAVPAVALAHGTSRHHQARHHAKRHARVRLRHFTAADSGTTGTTSGSPTTTGSNDAGKVTSFTPSSTDPNSGKLVITLNDGSTVSGMVTGDTELQCESATSGSSDSSSSQSGSMQSDEQSSGQDNGPTSGSDDNGTEGQDDQGDQTDQNDQGDNNDQGDDDGNQQSCSTSNLTPGTTVHEAELAISSTGAVWRGVDLVLS